jgi:hypothetical protein
MRSAFNSSGLILFFAQRFVMHSLKPRTGNDWAKKFNWHCRPLDTLQIKIMSCPRHRNQIRSLRSRSESILQNGLNYVVVRPREDRNNRNSHTFEWWFGGNVSYWFSNSCPGHTSRITYYPSANRHPENFGAAPIREGIWMSPSRARK